MPWGQKEQHEKFVEELQNLPYGSEKPVTLCEAFVRKYLHLKKSSVCMQMRRAVADAREIYKLQGREEELQKEPQSESVMVQYTWSSFFRESLAFAKSLVALGIPERACLTI